MENLYHESFHTTRQIPFELRLHRNEIDYIILKHWHRSIELDYLFQCEADFQIEGEKRHVEKGGLVIVNSSQVHALWPEKTPGGEGRVLAASLFISYDFLKELYPDFNHINFVLDGAEEKQEELKSLYWELIRLCQGEREPFSYLKVTGVLYQMLYLLFTWFKREKPGSAPRTQKYAERIRSVMAYIETNWMKPLTLQGAAAEHGFSPEYLAREFKKYTGITFREYLENVRLNQAVPMLVGSDMLIMEIAMKCGFADARSFISAFKKVYRMPPSHYRKLNRAEEAQRGIPKSGHPHILVQDN